MTSTAEPTLEAISDVVAKTGCRERQAKLYLKVRSYLKIKCHCGFEGDLLLVSNQLNRKAEMM
jgi:hypothetical protein